MLTVGKAWLYAILLFVLTAPLCASAATYYVSTSGSDSNPGTQASPFLTIQQGITTAVSGDTVQVASGTYTGSGNVDLDFGGRNITLQGAAASLTIIDCQGGEDASSHRGFSFHTGETSSAIVEGFTVENGFALNSAGGAVAISNGSSPSFLDCIFTGNMAEITDLNAGELSLGGAVAVVDGGAYHLTNNPTFTNCRFTYNMAYSGDGAGGGAFAFDGNGSVSLIHCTFSGNTAEGGPTSASNKGGAVCELQSTNSPGPLILTDCILYGDSATENSEIYNGSAPITVTYCDVQGGHTGTGNFSADPQFVSPATIATPNSGDYHIAATSPCVGHGIRAGASTDLDGRPYLAGPSIGAYEGGYSPTTISVSPYSYPTIQAAINISRSGDTVSVAAGSYARSGNVDLDFGGRNITLIGAGARQTTIDCQGNSSANHRGFTFHSGETSSAIVKGFTLQNGYETSAYASGGAVTIENGSSPSFQDCIFNQNTVDDQASSSGESYGGAVYVASGGASASNNPTFTNCLFTNNAADGLNEAQGGAFYFQDSGMVSLIHCTFSNNRAHGGLGYSGAVQDNGGGTVTLTNCTLYGDLASSAGNEIFTGNAAPTVSDCDIQGGYDGTGNFSANPQFADPMDHLRSNSPCIDAGAQIGVTTDLDGNPRDACPDIGCYEYPGHALLTTTGQNLTLQINQAFSGTVATLQSTDPNALPTDFTASINWGDNTTSTGTVVANGNAPTTDAALFNITGSHTYTARNNYNITVSITNTKCGTTAQARGAARVSLISTTTTVTSSQPGGSELGQPVTFTATVTQTSGGAAVPQGSVQFYVDNTYTGSPVTVSAMTGQASITLSALAVGSHTISADYTDTSSPQVYANSASSVQQTVTAGAPASIAFVQQPTQTAAGAAISPSPSVQVLNADSAPIAGASVALSLGGTGIGSLSGSATQTTDSTGTATFPGLSVTSPGAYTLTASVSGSSLSVASSGFTITNALKSLTASPTSVTGGPFVSFTATLTAKAASAATLSLTSSNSAVLSVPSTVTLGAGYGSVTFRGTSYPVTAITTVTITATYNGVSQTATVTVNPPALQGVTITPGSITGGGTATLEAFLNAKATVNATVTLTSSNPSALSVPATVTIGTTYTTVHFTATSHAVTATTTVTVTATYNGVSKTATVTVNPMPVGLASVTATPSSVVGGSANSTGVVGLTGKATATTTITLTSSSPSALSVPSTVTINPTYSTVHFTATSHAVTTTQTVTITATYNGVSQTATVTVTPAPPPTLSSVSATPSTIVGGSTNSTGTMTLTSNATGTVGVTLTSSNPSVLSVPYTVNIGAGYSSKTFTATSHAVTTSTTVTLTATYNGISKTTTVTVTP